MNKLKAQQEKLVYDRMRHSPTRAQSEYEVSCLSRVSRVSSDITGETIPTVGSNLMSYLCKTVILCNYVKRQQMVLTELGARVPLMTQVILPWAVSILQIANICAMMIRSNHTRRKKPWTKKSWGKENIRTAIVAFLNMKKVISERKPPTKKLTLSYLNCELQHFHCLNWLFKFKIICILWFDSNPQAKNL